jgi:hypothetical protein
MAVDNVAGVNKALIYYYFKNKDDIIHSLFQTITVEMGEQSGENKVPRNQPASIRDQIAQKIDFLVGRREIINAISGTNSRSNNAGLVWGVKGPYSALSAT